MELVILFDHRFYRTPGQTVYSPTSYCCSFFQKRYLSVFEKVNIVARVADVPADRVLSHKPTEGPGVTVVDLGEWTGARGFLKSRRAISHATKRFMGQGAAFVMIVPGGVPSIAFRHLVSRNYPFALEVVGDPWDAFSPGAIRHPLRPILRQWLSRNLRRQCELADGGLYVTKHALQRRYPCSGLTAGMSDVVLPPEAFASVPRTFDARQLKIITVGSLAHLYKGQDLLIDAVRICVQHGLDIHLVLVGDGKHRGELEGRAESSGIASRVRFAGEVYPASAIRTELDRADLFVLPSRAEGLPRALVEAMARALPCIGTCVGGIPELLAPDDLVAPRDCAALARRILDVASDRVRMAEMSLRNWRKAAGYEEQTMIAGRTEFYRLMRDRTRDRLSGNTVIRNGGPATPASLAAGPAAGG
jgi:glycosyltransferase involved in cell wall biosynthesis